MAWKKEAISDGEIDALARAARAVCNEDTVYPLWRHARTHGGGECLNMARWLVSRLGGDVGKDHGHYVWLSPDRRYFIDLTGRHTGHWIYDVNDGTYASIDVRDNERSRRFAQRADRLFESMDKLLRLSLDYAGDAYPAEEPQRQDDRDRFNDSWMEPEQYWHDETDPTTPEGIYQFIYANGQLEVSPNHAHTELAGHVGINPEVHTGPFAAGHVTVTNGRATWEVQANMNLHPFFRILKDATKNYGWTWGGMTDASGQPIIEQFAPKKSGTLLHYAFVGGHLYLGRTSAADLAVRATEDEGDDAGALTGTLRIEGTRAYVSPGHLRALPALFDWASDSGLTLYAGNDNVIKTIPDLQEKDNYDPQTLESPNPVEPPPVDERLPTGLYRCPGCSRLFPNWNLYSEHRPQCAEWANRDDPEANGDNGQLPSGDHDPIYGDGAHYHELRQTPGIGTVGAIVVLPARTWKEAARVDGFMRYAKAFKYDNDDYRFYVAYRNGDPLGYAAVGQDGNIQMMHSAVENQGVASAIWSKLARHYDSLYTHAAHDKTEELLKRHGWVQANGLKWRWAKDKAPTDLLDAAVPFIYDVQEDKIHVGHPGARTSDIPGRFTPGGIVEGNYEPGGKVVIRSLTSIPYTVRHLIELWYYTHPQLEVKSVHLEDDAGKDTRLASVGSHVKQLAVIDPAVHRAANALMQAGGEVYVVGGFVRDIILGKEPRDTDLMVTGIPEQRVANVLETLPGKVVHEGRAFKVFHYWHKGSQVHIALPRSERSTGPRHEEFDVQSDHTMKPEDDFYRRDFTANAMGVNLADGRLVDPFGGAADIASGTLRTLNDKSLVEDPLRIVRALSAHARHGLDPDEATRSQMSNYAHGLEHLPAERIQAELDEIFASPDPAGAIRLARDTGVLKYVLPEVDAAFGFDQNNPHHELELGDHLLSTLERISRKTEDPDLRLAALLHDIGKPGSEWRDPETGRSHYYEYHEVKDGKRTGKVLGAMHEELGAKLARERLSALKYPNARIDRIVALVANHMYAGFTTMAGARRFLARVGDHADDLFLLRWADQGGRSVMPHQEHEPAWNVDRNRKLVSSVREAKQAFTTRDLKINGHDLMRDGFEPGPILGEVLSHLTAQVIDDPALNEPETLLRLAREHANVHAG